MIPIEQQATCLELSKQLKDAGYPQDSLWHWVKLMGDNWVLMLFVDTKSRESRCFYYPQLNEFWYENEDSVLDVIAAPSIAEFLNKTLPKQIRYEHDYILQLKCYGDNWDVDYVGYYGGEYQYFSRVCGEKNLIPNTHEA